MPEVRFVLNIPADEFVRVYEGVVRDVVVRASDGRTVRFPARVLRPFVTMEGVHGAFAIRYDDRGSFVSIRRLGTPA